MEHDPAARGFGGLLLGAAAWLFAAHLEMPEWQQVTVFLLVGIGFPLTVAGRWKRF